MNATATFAQPGDEPLLKGVTVLDFTRVLAGPYSTRMLCDLGATVIKIERPGEGDEVRFAGLQLDPDRTDQSAYFARMNVGKRSVAVDLANPASRELLLDLVRKADVVVENFSPGVMKKYRLDYTTLSAIKPELVYCSISGYGQTGPLSSMQAYAHLINAFSGMMDLERAGIFPPKAANLQAADVLAGAHAFGAMCAALIRRWRTGRGAYVDVSMLESLVFADDMNFSTLMNGGEVLRQPRIGMVVHPIGDRHVAMQIGGGSQMWPRMCALLERPDLLEDPRFCTPGARREHWGELMEIIAQWLKKFESAQQAAETITAGRIPSVPVLMPEEVLELPHLKARQAFPKVPHPTRGEVGITALPFHLDGGPITPPGQPPYLIGQHTREVLAEVLGYDASRIAALEAGGAVACA
jgi:crotonobetainyl-CoA:carnitine CoA-transferase CaiB-like acyl-CoA transferase